MSYNYRNEALEFISDDHQVDHKLGPLLSELRNGDGSHFATAIEDLTFNEITDAVISQNIDKWAKRILELRENVKIKGVLPDAKILTNTYEEVKLSLSEIKDFQVRELTKMFEDYSIIITVESDSLLVRIIKDDNKNS